MLDDTTRGFARTFKGKVLIVSEFGAEANPANPADAPGGYAFQSWLLRRHIATYRALPQLAGMLVWNLRDFAVSPTFAGGSIKSVVPDIQIERGLNTKGLFDFGGPARSRRPRPCATRVRAARRRARVAARPGGEFRARGAYERHMDAQNAPDLVVARLAALQWGVVRRQQLVDAGLSRTAIAGRVRRGRLLPQYPGVYAVGHDRLRRRGPVARRGLRVRHRRRPQPPQRRRSLGPAAAGRGADRRHDRRPQRPARARRRARAPRAAAARRGDHRAGRHPDRHPGAGDPRAAPPTSTPEPWRPSSRRPTDAGGSTSPCSSGCSPTIRAGPGRRALRALLRGLEGGGPAVTRSTAEVDLLQLCDDHEVPIPVANAIINGFEVDFHWPQHDVDRRGRRLSVPPHAGGVRRRPRARPGAVDGGL